MPIAPAWRPMLVADLPAVDRIGDLLHPSYPEAFAVLAEKRALHPAGCLVLAGAGGIVGYAVSHPWRLGAPPALDTMLRALPAGADTLHVHDVALLPEARGAGAARAVVARLAGQAAGLGLGCLSLVAVGSAGAVWARLGFVAHGGAVGGYGAGARQMRREVFGGG